MLHDIAPHKYDVTYRKVDVEDEDMMLIYRDNALLCCFDGDEVVYPCVKDIAEVFPQVKEKAKFMFRIDDVDYQELRKPEIDPFGKWEYVPKDKIRELKPLWKVFAAVTGFQIHDFYTNTSFCGACGSEMEASGKERAMRCPVCGKVRYPQICPGVIVGVTDGDKLLLTKYSASHSTYRRYALIAGYTEVGESLEDTVRREVMEEVGLEVKNIRYYGSQPWSPTDTLLMGFFCEVDGADDITLDREELAVGVWMDRADMPDRRDDISLTSEMMEVFRRNLL
jgi:NAD+ diphosphatase